MKIITKNISINKRTTIFQKTSMFSKLLEDNLQIRVNNNKMYMSMHIKTILKDNKIIILNSYRIIKNIQFKQ